MQLDPHSAGVLQSHSQPAQPACALQSAASTGSIELEHLFEKFKGELINLLTLSPGATCACSCQTVQPQVTSAKLPSRAKPIQQGRESMQGAVLSNRVAPIDRWTYVEQNLAMKPSSRSHSSIWDQESVDCKHLRKFHGNMLERDKTAQIECSKVRRPVSRCYAPVNSYALTMQSQPEIWIGNQSDVQPGQRMAGAGHERSSRSRSRSPCGAAGSGRAERWQKY
jgi:hypothetical protein